MPQPITSDEGDANLTWNSQAGVSMPSTYLATTLNSVAQAQMPTAAEMAKIGVDIGDSTKLKAFYRQVAFTD